MRVTRERAPEASTSGTARKDPSDAEDGRSMSGMGWSASRRHSSLDAMRGGDVIADRFEVDRPAGSGGMGIVYRAIDRLTGEPVALKVLTGRTNDDSERFV